MPQTAPTRFSRVRSKLRAVADAITAGFVARVSAGARTVVRVAVAALLIAATIYSGMLLVYRKDPHVRTAIREAPHLIAMRGLALVTGRDPATLLAGEGEPGFLYIEAPQVYTRERLVNDRFRQSNWLEEELAATERRRQEGQGAEPSERRRSSFEAFLTVGSGTTSKPGAPPATPEGAVRLDRIDDFMMAVHLRDDIRNELMDAQLDDGHDLDGNTLYRLNFDAATVPFVGRKSNPGTAVFVVTAKRWRPEGQKETEMQKDDTQELLDDWRKEMQNFMSRIVAYRTKSFQQVNSLINPFSAYEGMAFDRFLRDELRAAYVDYLHLIGAPAVSGPGEAREAARFDRTDLQRMIGASADSSSSPDEAREAAHFHRAALQRIQRLESDREIAFRRQTDPDCANFEKGPKDEERCTRYPVASGQRAMVRLIAVLRLLIEDAAELKGTVFHIEADATQTPQQRLHAIYAHLLALIPEPLAAAPAAGRGACTQAQAVERAHCLFSRPDPEPIVTSLFAEFVEKRLNAKLKDYFPGDNKINKYLSIALDGCELGACRVLLGDLKNKKVAAADELFEYLNERRNDVTVYSLSPRARSYVVQSTKSGSREVAVNAPAGEASALAAAVSGEDVLHSVTAETYVVGFSDITCVETAGADEGGCGQDRGVRDRATFGWIVRPRQSPDGQWMADNHRFSAVLAVPSWWKRIAVEVQACWVSPYAAAQLDPGQLHVNPADICGQVAALSIGENVEESAPPGSAAASASRDAGPEASPSREFLVQLPRRIDEVMERFRLDVLKAPYFDADWLDMEMPGIKLEAGRPGRIVFVGERLWRSTVVTLSNTPADRIRVLPDMRGVIAEFDCVQPPAGEFYANYPRAAAKGETDARPADPSEEFRRATTVIWTSEGRTQPIAIQIAPFTPQHATELPCFVPG